jgi:hypothetical protein
MRARRFGGAVLSADGDPVCRYARRGSEQGGGRTNQNIDMRLGPRRQSCDRVDLVKIGIQAMHLPIAGD